MCDIGTINVKFYLLEVLYLCEYCRITQPPHFINPSPYSLNQTSLASQQMAKTPKLITHLKISNTHSTTTSCLKLIHITNTHPKSQPNTYQPPKSLNHWSFNSTSSYICVIPIQQPRVNYIICTKSSYSIRL